MIDLNKMTEEARRLSKSGEATVSVSRGVWFDEETGEQKDYTNFSVIADDVCGSGSDFGEAVESWAEKRGEETAKKVKEAKKLLEREGELS